MVHIPQLKGSIFLCPNLSRTQTVSPPCLPRPSFPVSLTVHTPQACPSKDGQHICCVPDKSPWGYEVVTLPPVDEETADMGVAPTYQF